MWEIGGRVVAPGHTATFPCPRMMLISPTVDFHAFQLPVIITQCVCPHHGVCVCVCVSECVRVCTAGLISEWQLFSVCFGLMNILNVFRLDEHLNVLRVFLLVEFLNVLCVSVG